MSTWNGVPEHLYNTRSYTWESYTTSDSAIRHPHVIVNVDGANPFKVVALPKHDRCQYCNTLAFEGERRCVACGAPL